MAKGTTTKHAQVIANDVDQARYELDQLTAELHGPNAKVRARLAAVREVLDEIAGHARLIAPAGKAA